MSLQEGSLRPHQGSARSDLTTKKTRQRSQPPSQQTRQPSMRSPKAAGWRSRKNLVWMGMWLASRHSHGSVVHDSQGAAPCAGHPFSALRRPLPRLALEGRPLNDWVFLRRSGTRTKIFPPDRSIRGNVKRNISPPSWSRARIRPCIQPPIHALCPVGCDVRARGRLRPGMAGRLRSRQDLPNFCP